MYACGLIGNCHVSAIIGSSGNIDWLCLPRPDSEPVFGILLDPDGGHFSISPSGNTKHTSVQSYVDNTNILVTDITCENGDAFRITDFCPRFEQHGRLYRPMAIFRIVEPISGSPAIQVSCRPVAGWTKEEAKPVRGNSHLRFDFREDSLRLITNMPITYLCEETSFQLKEKIYFGLTWSFGIEEDLVSLAERFLLQTTQYWRTWVKHCSIPTQFQKETIRSALVLKLHCFEDTGAILAALTTSLPESLEGIRNWDYRFCWLRDSYFVLSAFHNLGHFEEMEGFLKFLLNIAHQHDISRERLHPVYTLSQGLPIPEMEHPNWAGHKGSRPVRSCNQAAEHIQNDVYGEMVLTLAPIFFDERFNHLRSREHEDLLESLALLCAKTISVPDAGPWEFRAGWQEHTFANLMSWAGLERVERIQKNGYLRGLSFDVVSEKHRAMIAIDRALKEGSLRNGPGDESFDAGLSLLSVLRYPRSDVTENTIDQIRKRLSADNNEGTFFFRYSRSDDFGRPEAAFVVCSFWIAQALARLNRKAEASKLIERTFSAANSLGLYSEHYSPTQKLQLGNFPQAYSHVGLINAAFAVSPQWSEIL